MTTPAAERPSSSARADGAQGSASMLGEWLELSLPVDSLLDALATFESLGFRNVPVADFVPGPRAAVTDGVLSIGLYEHEIDEPALTFVRPDLRAQVRALEAAGHDFEQLQLGEDTFHSATLRDPSGVPLRFIEARSFPPASCEPTIVPVCGAFVEISLAVDSLDEAVPFWASLGFVATAEGDSPHAWRRLSAAGLTIGLHESARLRFGATFAAPQLAARVEYLRAKGFAPRPRAPLGDGKAGTLDLPGGLSFYLLGSSDETGIS